MIIGIIFFVLYVIGAIYTLNLYGYEGSYRGAPEEFFSDCFMGIAWPIALVLAKFIYHD